MRSDQLELLLEFSSILNSTHSTAEVREQAMALTCTLMHTDAATLYLVDPIKRELFFETFFTLVERRHANPRIDSETPARAVAFRAPCISAP